MARDKKFIWIKRNNSDYPSDIGDQNSGVVINRPNVATVLHKYCSSIGQTIKSSAQFSVAMPQQPRILISNLIFLIYATTNAICAVVNALNNKKASHVNDTKPEFTNFAKLELSVILSNLFITV